MKTTIRVCIGVIAALLSIAGYCCTAQGEARSVKLIVAFAPGGPVDITARTISARLGEVMGMPVIVENRAGANGFIGASFVAAAPPDGCTLLLASPGAMVIGPAFTPSMPFDTLRDFAPVTQVSNTGEVFVVGSSVKAQNLKDLIKLSKEGKTKLNFGTGGAGSLAHLAILLLNGASGTDIVHVPYTGMAPAITNVLGDQIEGAVGDLPVLLPHIRTGKLRALAVASVNRSPLVPQVPTMTEEGFPAVEANNWYGIFAPVKTPPDVVNKLHQAFVQTLETADIKQKLVSSGTDPVGSSPAQFTAMLKTELARWADLAKKTDLKLK